MIHGAHVVIYSENAEADREFFRDVLGFQFVDAGHGWLIFALPPAEVAFHPAEEKVGHEFYLMCDDLKAEMALLEKKRCPVLRRRGGTMGFLDKDAASRRRNGRSLSTKAPHGLRPEVSTN